MNPQKILQYGSDLFGSVRKRGLLPTLKLLIPELYFDWRYGTDTFKLVSNDELSDVTSESKAHGGPYQGANLYLFQKMMALLDRPGGRRDFSRDVFVDFGCGKGRALLMAAQLGCGRSVGVEYSPQLVETCRSNIEIFRRRDPRCPPIDVVHGDATVWEIPVDTTLFFFFNPFGDPVLGQVLARVRSSLRSRPPESQKDAMVIYLNPTQPEVFEREGFVEIAALKIDGVHKDGILYKIKPT